MHRISNREFVIIGRDDGVIRFDVFRIRRRELAIKQYRFKDFTKIDYIIHVWRVSRHTYKVVTNYIFLVPKLTVYRLRLRASCEVGKLEG